MVDGGITNTESLSSYSITLDSENPFGLSGLNTNAGYRSQAEGDADVGLDRETGYVAGADYTFPLTEEIEANVLGEWAGIRNLDGTDDDTDYFTAGLGLTLGGWNAATSYTARNTEVEGGTDTDDSMVQFSVGYEFQNGLTFDVGYLHAEESDVETDTLGGLLTYSFEF
jgi:predicted porin